MLLYDTFDEFKTLAHPIRRDILTLLSKTSLNASEIKGHFDVTPTAISNHLNILVNSGLVKKRKHKQYKIYSINKDGITKIINYLDGLLNSGT